MARNVSSCWRAVATRSSSNTHTAYPVSWSGRRVAAICCEARKWTKRSACFFLRDSAYESHGFDSLLAELPGLDGLPWRDCVGVDIGSSIWPDFGPSGPSLAVPGGTTPLTYFRYR